MALGVYNRGENAGVNIASIRSGSINVGNAQRDQVSQNVSDGFYAVSYNLNGVKLISFRGTDIEGGLPSLDDVMAGWISGAGLWGTQAEQAADFYQLVTGLSVFSGTAATNTVLTGHSLGGG